jgi:hypothetical protein
VDLKARAELEELVRDMRDDPKGWSGPDISNAMELAGFAAEDIEEVEGWPWQVRYHPAWRHLRLPIPMAERVNSHQVRQAANLIAQVLERTKPNVRM